MLHVCFCWISGGVSGVVKVCFNVFQFCFMGFTRGFQSVFHVFRDCPGMFQGPFRDCVMSFCFTMFNRPGVAKAVLKTPSSLIHSFINSVSHPFPPNLQNIITPKPSELGT